MRILAAAAAVLFSLAGIAQAQVVGPTSYSITPGVSRDISSLGSDLRQVRDFGAICDGGSHPLSNRFATLTAAQAVFPGATALTEETDLAAINAGLANGGHVQLPDGKCVINGSIVPTSGSALVGRGQGISTIFAEDGSAPSFRPIWIGGSVSTTGVLLRDFTLDGGWPANGTNTWPGLLGGRFYSIDIYPLASYVTIDRVEIKNALQGPHVGAPNVTIENSYIHDNWGNGLWIIGSSSPSIQYATDVTVRDNRVVHNALFDYPTNIVNGAVLTATISGGAVTGVTITAAGTGGTNGTYPLSFFNGNSGGSGATGTYTVSGGVITATSVTAGGSGYTSAPGVTAETYTGTGSTWYFAHKESDVAGSFDGIATGGLTQRVIITGNYVLGNDIFLSEPGYYSSTRYRSSDATVRGNIIDSSVENGFNIQGPIDRIDLDTNVVRNAGETSYFPTNTTAHGCLIQDGSSVDIRVSKLSCNGATTGYSVAIGAYFGNDGAWSNSDTTPPSGVTLSNIAFRDVTNPSDPSGAHNYLTVANSANVKVSGMTIAEDRGGGSGAAYAIDSHAGGGASEFDSYTAFAGTSGTTNPHSGDTYNQAGTVFLSTTVSQSVTGLDAHAQVIPSVNGTPVGPTQHILGDTMTGAGIYAAVWSPPGYALCQDTSPAFLSAIYGVVTGNYTSSNGNLDAQGHRAKAAFPDLTAWASQIGINFGLQSANTTDWAVIQDALAWVGAHGGGTVRLPFGTCWINRSLIVPANVRLTGQGVGNTVIAESPLSGTTYAYQQFAAIEAGNYASGALITSGNNVEIDHLTVNGENTFAPQNNGAVAGIDPIYGAINASQTTTSSPLTFPSTVTGVEPGMPIEGPGVPHGSRVGCTVGTAPYCAVPLSITIQTPSGTTIPTTLLAASGANYEFNGGYFAGWDALKVTTTAAQDNSGVVAHLAVQANNGDTQLTLTSATGIVSGMRPGVSAGSAYGQISDAITAGTPSGNVVPLVGGTVSGTIPAGTEIDFTTSTSGAIYLSALTGTGSNGQSLGVVSGTSFFATNPNTGAQYQSQSAAVVCNQLNDGSNMSGGNCVANPVFLADPNGNILVPGMGQYSSTGSVQQIPSGASVAIGGMQVASGIGIWINPTAQHVKVHDVEILAMSNNNLLDQGDYSDIHNIYSHDAWLADANMYGDDNAGAGPMQIACHELFHANWLRRPARYNFWHLNGPDGIESPLYWLGNGGARGAPDPTGFDMKGTNGESCDAEIWGNRGEGLDFIFSEPWSSQEQSASGSATPLPVLGHHRMWNNVVLSTGNAISLSGYVNDFHEQGDRVEGGAPSTRNHAQTACVYLNVGGIADLRDTFDGLNCSNGSDNAGIYYNGSNNSPNAGGVTFRNVHIWDWGSGSTGSGYQFQNIGSGVAIDGGTVCGSATGSSPLTYDIDTSAAGKPVTIRAVGGCPGSGGPRVNLQTGSNADFLYKHVAVGPVAQRPATAGQGDLWDDPATGMTEYTGSAWQAAFPASGCTFGTTGGTCAQGNDSRIVNALPATGGAVTGNITGMGTYAYVLANAGTVARPLGQQVGDVANARDFGAICDGTLHTLGATAPYSTMTSTQLYQAFPDVVEARLTSGKSVDWAAIEEMISKGVNGVSAINMTNRGTGGTPGTYAIVFTGGTTGATAYNSTTAGQAAGTYTIDSTGRIVSTTITNPSWGYLTFPTPTFPSGGVANAAGLVVPTSVKGRIPPGTCLTNYSLQVYSTTDLGGSGPGSSIILAEGLDSTDGGTLPYSTYDVVHLGKYFHGAYTINGDNSSVHDMSIWGTGTDSFSPQYQTLTNGPISVPNSGGTQSVVLNLDNATGLNVGDPVWEQATNTIPPRTTITSTGTNTVTVSVPSNSGAFTIPANAYLTFRGLLGGGGDNGIHVDNDVQNANVFNVELAYHNGNGIEYDGINGHFSHMNAHDTWFSGWHAIGDWNNSANGPVVQDSGNILEDSVCGPRNGLYHFFVHYGPGHFGDYQRGASTPQLPLGYDCAGMDSQSMNNQFIHNLYTGPGSTDQIITDACFSNTTGANANELQAIWNTEGLNCYLNGSAGNSLIENVFMNSSNVALQQANYVRNTTWRGNVVINNMSSQNMCALNVTDSVAHSGMVIEGNILMPPIVPSACAINLQSFSGLLPENGGIILRDNVVDGWGLSGQGAPVTIKGAGQRIRWKGGAIIDHRSGGLASFVITGNGTGGTNGTFYATFTGGGPMCQPAVQFTVASGAVVPSSIEIVAPGFGCTSNPTPSFAASAGLTGVTYTESLWKGGVPSVTITASGNGGTQGNGYPLAFSGGTQCTPAGTYTISGGAVTAVTITNSGEECAFPPTVSFPNGGVTGATGVSVMNLLNTSVASVTITNGGTGGTNGTGYALAFSGGTNCLPTGTYTIGAAGHVSGTSITYPGFGCTSAPTVSFPSGGVTGATATANLENANGEYAIDISGSGPNTSIMGGDFQQYSTGTVNLVTGQTWNPDDTLFQVAATGQSLTATGTSCSSGALQLTSTYNLISAGSGGYVILPTTANTHPVVANQSGGAILVCPPGGGTINGSASVVTENNGTSASYTIFSGTVASSP